MDVVGADRNRIFGRVKLEYTHVVPGRCDYLTYLEKHRNERTEVNNKVEAAAKKGRLIGCAGGAVVGTFGGKAVGGAVATKVGMAGSIWITGPFALGGAIAVGHLGALTGENIAKKRALRRELNALEEKDQFKAWRMDRTRKVKEKTFEILRKNLDAELAILGLVDPNYRCCESHTLMYKPRVIGGYGIFDKSLLDLHQPDEDGCISIGGKLVEQQYVQNTFYCMGVKIDCLRVRITFIQSLIDAAVDEVLPFSNEEMAALRGLGHHLEASLEHSIQKLDECLGEYYDSADRNDADVAIVTFVAGNLEAMLEDDTVYPYAS